MGVTANNDNDMDHNVVILDNYRKPSYDEVSKQIEEDIQKLIESMSDDD